MNLQQAINEIKDYFNLEMMPHDIKKITAILESVTREKVIIKYRNVQLVDSKEIIFMNLEEEGQRIAAMYGTTLEAIKGKRRDMRNVSARAHLVRYARLNSKVTITELARYLNKDHTSICHLLYSPKPNCSIPPLYKSIRFAK